MRRESRIAVMRILVAALLFHSYRAPLKAEELLPALTGPHKTGRMSFHWMDDSRAEIETKATDDKRELMVHLFYPADPKATGDRAAYVPDAVEMRGPWKPDQIARLTNIRAYGIFDAKLPPGNDRYPVLIFSPGGGMKALTYHTLCEDLASHGWVVAAIDHPYNAKAVRLPDGRVLGNLKPEERGWSQPKSREEFERNYRERIVHMARDIKFVIDQLTALDANNGPFGKRLDVARGVGVFGHSRGGQAAGTVRLIDERVKGAINIDGATGDHAVIPAKDGDGSGVQPFLWIQKHLPNPTDEQIKRAKRTRAETDAEIARILASWRKNLGEISGGAIRVYIDRPEVEHIDFSDEPFWDGHMTAESRPVKEQTIAETRAWLRAFFDGTIRGEWKPLQELVANPPAKVNVETFGKLWP